MDDGKHRTKNVVEQRGHNAAVAALGCAFVCRPKRDLCLHPVAVAANVGFNAPWAGDAGNGTIAPASDYFTFGDVGVPVLVKALLFTSSMLALYETLGVGRECISHFGEQLIVGLVPHDVVPELAKCGT